MATTISRVYNALARAGLAPFPSLPRFVRYGLRTALLGLLLSDTEQLPPLRLDVKEHADRFDGAVARFRDIVEPYAGEIRWPLGRIFNGPFDSVDAYLYYSVIRTFRPRSIIEVGSGNSAWTARDALERNGGGHLTAIDPKPRIGLPKEATWLPSKVESVPLQLFRDLARGDVLFIDSSHRMDEVSYHCQHILPLLSPGVLIHIHDFCFPYDSGYAPDPQRFDETDAWLRQLASQPPSLEVVTCAPFVRYAGAGLLERLVPPYARTPNRVPGSLWLKKL